MSLSDYTPPADASGGFMVVKVTNGVDTHRERVHVRPFGAGAAVSGAGYHGATWDYAYTTAAGTETTVGQTWYNLCANQLQANYPATYTISLDALYKTTAGVPAQVPVPPNVTPVVGTSAGAVSTKDRYTMQNWNCRTTTGGRFRLSIIGGAGASTQTAQSVTTSNSFVAYLEGANCAIVGHDGGQPIGNVHITIAENRRLRRHYGQA